MWYNADAQERGVVRQISAGQRNSLEFVIEQLSDTQH